MRLAAALLLALSPLTAVGWTVEHWHAQGAVDGVFWALGLVGVLLLVCVVGAELERRLDG